MRADEAVYKEWLHTLSREALEEECFGRKQDADHNRILLEESQKSLTATSKDYKKTADELKALRDECRKLNETIRHMEAEQTLGRRDRFGCRGECLNDLLASSPGDLKDPTDEEAGDEPEGEEPCLEHSVRSRALHLVRSATGRGRQKEKPSLSDMLRKLPERQQKAVVMRLFQQQDFSEIAAEMETTPGNARVILARALDKLEKEFSAVRMDWSV